MRLTMALASLLVLAMCTGSRAEPKPAPRTVVGRAVDTRGAPLAGVAIWADVQAVWSRPGRGVTAADGSYRVEKLMAHLIYKVFAWHQVSYRGKSFCLRLAPDGDAAEFAGKEGAARSFRWRLTGPMEDAAAPAGEPATTWGGDVRVFTEFADGDYEGTLELRFTPDGPLIDGSEGRPLERKIELARTTFATDIPVGVYKVTGSYRTRDGRREPVRFGDGAEQARAEGALEFKPVDVGPQCGSASTGNGVERAFLHVRRP